MATTFEGPAEDGRNGSLANVRSGLEEVEQDDRPPWLLTRTELKLLGIAGVGFFLDAYDIFIINPIATMLQFRLYNGNAIPSNIQGFMKAGTNIGAVIGQFLFGYLADALGRKRVYGKELMVIILATILCMTVPTGSISPNGCIIYLGCFRILLGVGVGGDYPMSASVSSDRSSVRRRGSMLTYVFANQGWGSLVGSVVTMIVLLCYKPVMEDKGETSKVDGVWRIVIGLSLIPAFGTLYQRLTLGEAKRFEASKRLEDDEVQKEKRAAVYEKKDSKLDDTNSGSSEVEQERGVGAKELARRKKSHMHEFLSYMSEWRHAKILLGTCSCWFLLDIAFYGINLNQNVVLEQIGLAGTSGSDWTKLFKIATGNLIITVLGFVPGYYVSAFTIEWLGRKWIQIQGFLMCALLLGILAGKFNSLGTVPFIVVFALLQFFFNFGANTTTYVYPAELFPSRFKAFAHGMSAACGKAGAIISALVFNTLTNSIGTPNVLWIFVACCILGAFFTLLLPETRGRDPDLIDAEEIRADREARGAFH